MHWAVTWRMSHEECRPQVARVWGQYIDIWCIQILILSTTTTTFNLTVNKPKILTHAKRRDFYCRAYQYILQVTVKISSISWDSSTRVHHCVMALSVHDLCIISQVVLFLCLSDGNWAHTSEYGRWLLCRTIL